MPYFGWDIIQGIAIGPTYEVIEKFYMCMPESFDLEKVDILIQRADRGRIKL